MGICTISDRRNLHDVSKCRYIVVCPDFVQEFVGEDIIPNLIIMEHELRGSSSEVRNRWKCVLHQSTRVVVICKEDKGNFFQKSSWPYAIDTIRKICNISPENSRISDDDIKKLIRSMFPEYAIACDRTVPHLPGA